MDIQNGTSFMAPAFGRFQSFRFLHVGALKKFSVFSSILKWKDTSLTHFYAYQTIVITPLISKIVRPYIIHCVRRWFNPYPANVENMVSSL